MSIACMNISDFYKDERVSQLNKRNTIFEILSLKEENTSNILDWLLDPKESHGAGNAFASFDKADVKFYFLTSFSSSARQ